MMEKKQRIETPEIRVIAIVGMGGVGKTTLAQLVYNDSRLKEPFPLKAWICVGVDFKIIEIINSIIELLNSSHSHRRNLELIQRKLRETVARKRCLIVLDDILDDKFDSKHWASLCGSLASAAPGSTIIVTTRHENIAKIFSPNYIHPLKELRKAECSALIKLHAFHGMTPTPDDIMEDFIEKIAEKCSGLPLVASVLGGLLGSNIQEEHWERIANNELWELPEMKTQILPQLLLSYSFLPFHLKRCLAYCSIFPRNYQFSKDKLVLLWIAEGFIAQADNSSSETLEKLGDDCFHELLRRSFLQSLSSNQHCYVMHDLIRGLAIYVMEDFGTTLESVTREGNGWGRLRHFSYTVSKYETQEKFKRIIDTNPVGLRTFLPIRTPSCEASCYLSYNMLEPFIPLFAHLRVLSLSGYKISIPSSIGTNLKALRYLDLSSTLIEELPGFVCKLYLLQTLLLSKCSKLKRLPAGITNLTQMRHLDISGTENLEEMPKDISRLTGLQTLTDFVVGDVRHQGASIKELQGFRNLRGSLTIRWTENSAIFDVGINRFVKADLDSKEKLEELIFYGHQGSSFEWFQPNKNLRRLTIEGCLGNLPDWVGDAVFHKLEVVHLKNNWRCERLPALGQLPKLKRLSITKLGSLRKVGLEIIGSSTAPFKSLESLELSDLKVLETWDTHEQGTTYTPFPFWQELSLVTCQRLRRIFPLAFPSLKTLKIVDCPILKARLLHMPLLHILKLEGCLSISNELDFENLTNFTCLTSRYVQVLPFTQLHNLRYLEQLEIKGSPLPDNFRLPQTVRSAQIYKTMHDVKQCIIGSTMLQYLDISGKGFEIPEIHCQLLNCLRVSNGRLRITSAEDDGLPNCPQLYDLDLHRGIVGGFRAQNLTSLSIHGCKDATCLPDGMRDNFPSIQFLSISDCSDLKSLPVQGFPNSLKMLKISKCHGLVGPLPSQCLPPNLRQLHVSNCNSLKSPPDGILAMHTSLEVLNITDCKGMRGIPSGNLPPRLQILHVECSYAYLKVRELPFLKVITFEGCLHGLRTFPEDYSLPSTLQRLTIRKFRELRSINCGELQRLTCLQELHIRDCPSLEKFCNRDLLQSSLCLLDIGQTPESMKPHRKKNRRNISDRSLCQSAV